MLEESRVKLHVKKMYALVMMAAIVVLIILFYLVTHSNGAIAVKSGDNVTVFYSLWLSNGTLVQSNFNSTPFSFIAGSSQVIKGFNDAVMGMKEGQTKNVTLLPSEAYGNVNDSLIITVPRTDFGNNSISVGEHVSSENGASGVITALNSTKVTINLNPPLAGKTLIFEIKVVKISH